jgi:hypothetical protein
VSLLCLALGGCGGAATPIGTSNQGSGPPYAFTAPVANSTRSYTDTVTDNTGNTIDLGFTETVNVVNPDGSFVVEYQPSSDSIFVNGTNYGGPSETQSYDTSGHEVSYVFTAADASIVTCNLDPHGIGPDFPVRVGATWSIQYALDCTSTPTVTYTQSGTVEDVETVAVPAGTYLALKLQSTLSWTDAGGTTRTESITNWRDVASSVSVKQEITIAYSGALPTTGYAVKREILLMATS